MNQRVMSLMVCGTILALVLTACSSQSSTTSAVTATRPQPTPGIYSLAEKVADRLCRKLKNEALTSASGEKK